MTITETPDGLDALIFTKGARLHKGISVFIARDQARASSFTELCRFFAPDLDLIELPAWDCLPYDRISPSSDLAAQRAYALMELAKRKETQKPCLVISSIAAITQRTAPRAHLAGSGFSATPGEVVDRGALEHYLSINGYARTSSVIEAGDYAIRGGVVDIFPSGASEPLRLDFFGDSLESVRAFSPETQRTTHQLSQAILYPVSEVMLTPETIASFRRGYVEAFGGAHGDLLYESISAGHRAQGCEHWLALFYGGLETVFDYLGPDPLITLDFMAGDAFKKRRHLIEDYYHARTDKGDNPSLKTTAYKALPPDSLYISQQDWTTALQGHKVRILSPFSEAHHTALSFGGRQGRVFAAERQQKETNIFATVSQHMEELQKQGRRVVLAAWSEGSATRLTHVFEDHGLTKLTKAHNWAEVDALPPSHMASVVLPLEKGFETDEFVFLCEQDVLGDRLTRPSRKKRMKNVLSESSSLSTGDLVVHADHGIARYHGLKTLGVEDMLRDCLELEYAGGDRLFLPVENIELLSRYGSHEAASLDKLGGVSWQARKARAKKRLLAMAGDLIKTAAARTMRHMEVFTPPEGAFDEFCAGFPYAETEDQLAAIEDVLEDLTKGRPMDRLICGDVGFGKTEVALRAAFVVAMSGRQVALIAPTTLLVRQHFQTFKERFKDWPVKLRALSRLTPAKMASATRKELEEGQCELVIGTHALLGERVKFRDLGLVIVDEEQRFGVKSKERLKNLRADVHVLTLSATPIPRTLQLAMSGIRDLSLIATPPIDRLAVRTYVTPFDTVVVREALLREKYRSGQSFYIVPHIADLDKAESFLRDHVPEIRFTSAHGRLPGRQLEEIMTQFYEGQYDVLLSTSIVESGLDIPKANTLIIQRADHFGLAQLYQMRGRVGRSKTRAYAYLTTPAQKKLTNGAEQRLKVLQSLDSLGAGFSLASHDLDMRGGGNLLGEEQSGHIRDVGVELYQSMLEESVASLRAEGEVSSSQDWSPQIQIGTAVLLPDTYITDLDIRLSLYRRIAALETAEERDAFAAELIDRFGPLPEQAEHLLYLTGLKTLCKRLGLAKLEAGPKGAVMSFREGAISDPAALVQFVAQQPRWKLRPDNSLVIKEEWGDIEIRFKRLSALLSSLLTLREDNTA